MTATATDQVTIYAEAARQALDALAAQRERLEAVMQRRAADARTADTTDARKWAADRYLAQQERHNQLSDAIEAIETALLAN